MSQCWSYCEHGGVCELDRGHKGLHDSSYCRWDDDHAISKTKADDIFRRRGGPVAEGIIAVGELIEALEDGTP